MCPVKALFLRSLILAGCKCPGVCPFLVFFQICHHAVVHNNHKWSVLFLWYQLYILFPFFTFDSKYLNCISPFLSMVKSLLFHLYIVKNKSFISYFLYFYILFHSFLSALLLFILIYNLVSILFLIYEVIDSNKVPFSTFLHFCFSLFQQF